MHSEVKAIKNESLLYTPPSNSSIIWRLCVWLVFAIYFGKVHEKKDPVKNLGRQKLLETPSKRPQTSPDNDF